MNYQLGRDRSPLVSGLLLALVTASLVSLDLTFHEHQRGIVAALVAVPALSLAVPADRPLRWPLFAGALALGGTLVSGVADWRNRPFVLLATFGNIALLTAISHRLQPRLHPLAPPPAATSAPPPEPPGPADSRDSPNRPTAPRARTYTIGDFRLALRTVPQANRTTLVADLCDARESPYGTRVLVADLMGKDDATEAAGNQLLDHWRRLAATEPSLAEITRRLDADLAEHTERFAKALLITFHEDRAELVCCGHPPPLLLSDGGEVRELNVLTPLPPLGLFDLAPYGSAVYTTSFTVSSAQRLLLYTDGMDAVVNTQGRPFPLRDWARVHGYCPPGALLDALVSDLTRHAGGDLDGLRDEALLLLLQAEKRGFRHVTTALHADPASNHVEARGDCDPAGV
ncbi:PP2C family protein-serine/threonine phosphatase [Streptomyces sp. NPDC020607]|uniref:PP2C family protein-serine/threonine phosphatase n=1 Tax=Streptomyces sp. NPDC020607 TaxID=3365082 RepID=UPI003799459A